MNIRAPRKPRFALQIPPGRMLAAALAVVWLGLMSSGGRAESPDVAPPVDGEAYLREWTPPEYPAQELKDKVSATVLVRMIVDATGHVTQARALTGGDPAFVAAAVAAVKKWVFDPATEGGKPVASCLDGPVVFEPALANRKPEPGEIPPQPQWPLPAEQTPAKENFTPRADYPASLEQRMLPGVARFHCTVGVDGKPFAARITGVSHVDLVLPALASLRAGDFTPAMQGDLPVVSEVDGEFTFDSVLVKWGEVLAANAITGSDGGPPEIPLEPRVVADPVWPIDDLLAGEDGAATVEFVVTETGAVTDVRVREATKPEFGQALAAALQTWLFSRPIGHAGAVSVPMVKRTEFKAVPAAATEDDVKADPIGRLVVAMRKGEIGSAKGLDARLTPVYRVAPEYPQALKGEAAPEGRAEIEFVIDRDGRSRLPRIVSASREEFGWAAATAVAQWVFEAPRRKGEPVDVKVRIPFDFKAP
ncbi:MAG TPA: TonB family protein [Opitutus sp.]|nr:TonB family protein [Opitutus sp.]